MNILLSIIHDFIRNATGPFLNVTEAISIDFHEFKLCSLKKLHNLLLPWPNLIRWFINLLRYWMIFMLWHNFLIYSPCIPYLCIFLLNYFLFVKWKFMLTFLSFLGTENDWRRSQPSMDKCYGLDRVFHTRKFRSRSLLASCPKPTFTNSCMPFTQTCTHLNCHIKTRLLLFEYCWCNRSICCHKLNRLGYVFFLFF